MSKHVKRAPKSFGVSFNRPVPAFLQRMKGTEPALREATVDDKKPDTAQNDADDDSFDEEEKAALRRHTQEFGYDGDDPEAFLQWLVHKKTGAAPPPDVPPPAEKGTTPDSGAAPEVSTEETGGKHVFRAKRPLPTDPPVAEQEGPPKKKKKKKPKEAMLSFSVDEEE